MHKFFTLSFLQVASFFQSSFAFIEAFAMGLVLHVLKYQNSVSDFVKCEEKQIIFCSLVRSAFELVATRQSSFSMTY
jgi:hypothetical protein